MKQFYQLLKCYLIVIITVDQFDYWGVSLNNTINKKNLKEQISIFEVEQQPNIKNENLDKLIDKINENFDHPLVTKASALSKKEKQPQKKYLK